MKGSNGEWFSQDIWDEVIDRIPRIAVKYPDIDPGDLGSELMIALLDLRRKRPPNPVGDWIPYLMKCLLNRASEFAGEWRDARSNEQSLEAAPNEIAAPAVLDHLKKLVTIPLNKADRELVKHLIKCNFNVTLVAKERGCHRNTIHRQFAKIRDKCPIDIESAAGIVLIAKSTKQERGGVNTKPSIRNIRRHHILDDLNRGLTYRQIVQLRKTSNSTIARWRKRNRVTGIQSKHKGKRTSEKHNQFMNWLRANKTKRKLPPNRELAQRFELSKSTIHRIVQSKKWCTSRKTGPI